MPRPQPSLRTDRIPALEPRRRRSFPVRFLGAVLGWAGGLIRFLLFTSLFFFLMVLASYWIIGYFIRGHELLAPNLVGQRVDAALDVLKEEGLYLQKERREPNDEFPEDRIVSQYPPAGSIIKAGTPIRVVLSAGSPLITVPELRGETRTAAGIRLRNAGLEEGNAASVHFPNQPGGTVMASDPPGGTGVAQGSKVNLLINSGQKATERRMPNLVGLTVANARELLAQEGLILAEEHKIPAEGVLPDQIHQQFPPPGEVVTASTRISVSYAPSAEEQAQPAAEAGTATGPAPGAEATPEPGPEPEGTPDFGRRYTF